MKWKSATLAFLFEIQNVDFVRGYCNQSRGASIWNRFLNTKYTHRWNQKQHVLVHRFIDQFCFQAVILWLLQIHFDFHLNDRLVNLLNIWITFKFKENLQFNSMLLLISCYSFTIGQQQWPSEWWFMDFSTKKIQKKKTDLVRMIGLGLMGLAPRSHLSM